MSHWRSDRFAICVAAENNDVALLRQLLEQGFRANLTDRYGDSPLRCAARTGAVEAGKCLIEAKATIDEPDSGGYRPLHLALQAYRRTDLEMAKFVTLLLDNGVSVDSFTT